ncbi:monooxygenase [Rhizophlyctis rosea]|nr:monooxygenase [Rhizophlyctis rosea]
MNSAARAAERTDVCIIGAGVAGLTTAKTFLQHDSDFFTTITVLEKHHGIGGVWADERIYPGLQTNNATGTYEFSDFPYVPEEGEDTHMPAHRLQAYLISYAKTFGVDRVLKLNTMVLDASIVDTESKSVWKITTRPTKDLDVEPETRYYRFLVVCAGMYQRPNIPTFSGIESFKGTILHSCELGLADKRQKMLETKNVVVVGAGKSAVDVANMVANNRNGDVVMVFKRPHWLAPRKIFYGTVGYKWFFFSRLLELFHPFVNQTSSMQRFLHNTSFGRTICRGIFWAAEWDFILSNGQQNIAEMNPLPHLPLAVATSGLSHVTPPGFFDNIKEKRLGICRGGIETVKEKRVIVRTLEGHGVELDADCIVYATGYELAFPFFKPETLERLAIQATPEDPSIATHLKLYRYLIPTPTINNAAHNIAFNGFSYSLNNPTVMEVSAHWLAEYFRNAIPLPDQDQIEKEVDELLEWQIRVFDDRGKKGVHLGYHGIMYCDELLGDMKVACERAGGWVWEMFAPYWPRNYKGVGEERALSREERLATLTAQ